MILCAFIIVYILNMTKLFLSIYFKELKIARDKYTYVLTCYDLKGKIKEGILLSFNKIISSVAKLTK